MHLIVDWSIGHLKTAVVGTPQPRLVGVGAVTRPVVILWVTGVLLGYTLGNKITGILCYLIKQTYDESL